MITVTLPTLVLVNYRPRIPQMRKTLCTGQLTDRDGSWKAALSTSVFKHYPVLTIFMQLLYTVCKANVLVLVWQE